MDITKKKGEIEEIPSVEEASFSGIDESDEVKKMETESSETVMSAAGISENEAVSDDKSNEESETAVGQTESGNAGGAIEKTDENSEMFAENVADENPAASARTDERTDHLQRRAETE